MSTMPKPRFRKFLVCSFCTDGYLPPLKKWQFGVEIKGSALRPSTKQNMKQNYFSISCHSFILVTHTYKSRSEKDTIQFSFCLGRTVPLHTSFLRFWFEIRNISFYISSIVLQNSLEMSKPYALKKLCCVARFLISVRFMQNG